MADSSVLVPAGTIATYTNAAGEQMQVVVIGTDGVDAMGMTRDVTLITSASRTASHQSADQTNYYGRALHVVVDMTTPGTGSITVTIQGKDALSGKYYTLLASAAITTTTTNVYRVGPALTASANLVANDVVPRTWRVSIVHNNANACTYSIGASLVP